MQAMQTAATERYAKCIEVSKRVRWEIERDVIRGRKSSPSSVSCSPLTGPPRPRAMPREPRLPSNIRPELERLVAAEEKRARRARKAMGKGSS